MGSNEIIPDVYKRQEYGGGEINASHSGALQELEIRDAICDVMEGGREALDARYYRISKALLK